MKPTYTLVVTPEMNKVLHKLNLILLRTENEGALRELYDDGLMGALLDLVMETEKGKHDAGWCTDPDCKFKSIGREIAARQIRDMLDEDK